MSKKAITIRVSFVLFLIAAGSCVNHDIGPIRTCQVADAAEDLPWLKAEIAQLENSDLREYWFITAGTHEEQSVFVIRNCCPFCNTITPVYSCEGVLLFHLSKEQIDHERIVWKSADYACSF